MTGRYIILILIALFSFTPIAILLYKRRRVKRIIENGVMVKATVYLVSTTYRVGSDFVAYSFYDPLTGRQYSGRMNTKIGLYKKGDLIEVYYLPQNPKRNTVKGAWQSNLLLAFAAAIVVFVCWAMYQLYVMVEKGDL